MVANGKFLTSSDVTEDTTMDQWLVDAQEELDATVKLTGAQTIAGNKTFTGAFTSIGIDDNAPGERLSLGNTQMSLGAAGIAYSFVNAIDDQSLFFAGGNAFNKGGVIVIYGSTHGSKANDIEFKSGATIVANFDDSANRWSVPSGIDFAFGEMIITEHGANQPRITWDTDDYQRYIQVASQMQYVVGNVARWSWDSSYLGPAVDGAYDLGTSSLHFGTAYSQRFEVDANFHAEINTLKPRITLDSLDYIEFVRATDTFNTVIGGSAITQHNAFKLFVNFPIQLKTYTVGTLPTGANGFHAFASDLRNGAEGAGVGTGGPVYFANSNWRRYEDNAVAAA